MQGSASAPTLPPVPPQVRAAQQRGLKEAAKRKEFLGGLINQDLKKLTQWHGMRPAHEQKRFLRSLDCLYKAYDAASEPKGVLARREAEAREAREARHQAARQVEAQEEAAQRAAEQDPLAGPPRSPRARPATPAASSDLKPIEVFEQKKRKKLRKKDPTADDPNTLDDWLEGYSLTSATTATTASTKHTRFSDLTMTSLASSICSHPGTLVHESYRPHKRAYAVNINDWKPVNQHEAGALKDGIPGLGRPDAERMHTSFQDQFGAPVLGQNITKKMYEKVVKGDQHEFITRFLEQAPPEQRQQFTGLVRSLEYLRLQKHREDTSTSNLHMDLHENARLWRPPKQRPMFDKSEINISRVPLGTLVQEKIRTTEAPPPPPPYIPPPSPSVSGLGSLPLTRVATPLGSDAGSS